VSRFLVKIINVTWLVIVFIGVPAITHASIGNWNITQASTSRMLLFSGLALAAVINLLLGFTFKKTKDRILCWEWTTIFAGLLLVQYAYSRGYLNFDWLKKFLQSLQPRL
jgi:uncharacterized membrane protein